MAISSESQDTINNIESFDSRYGSLQTAPSEDPSEAQGDSDQASAVDNSPEGSDTSLSQRQSTNIEEKYSIQRFIEETGEGPFRRSAVAQSQARTDDSTYDTLELLQENGDTTLFAAVHELAQTDIGLLRTAFESVTAK